MFKSLAVRAFSTTFLINFFFSISEIEAIEACKWLRAAGFPQYAQMYEGKSHLSL